MGGQPAATACGPSKDTRSRVTSVFLSADGRYALSGSEDKTIRLWTLDWELEDNEPADWDDEARPYLEVFLAQQTPYAASLPPDRQPTEEEIALALTRRGRPAWTEDDFQRLLDTLGCAGFGWLRPEGVRRELEKMAADWQGPRSLVAPSNAIDDVSREDHPLPASDDLFSARNGRELGATSGRQRGVARRPTERPAQRRARREPAL